MNYKKRKIVYIHRAEFHKRPPVINVIYNLLSLGVIPVLITSGISDYFEKNLRKRGVIIHVVPYNVDPKSKYINKVLKNITYRRRIYSLLKKYKPNNYTLWIEGNYTFTALVGPLILKYTYILQIQELYKNFIEKKATRYLLNKASVVFMPEYNRSVLYFFQFQMQYKPYILPNKPYFQFNNIISEKVSKVVFELKNKVKNRKIILYQGLISKERDLTAYVKAIRGIQSEYCLVLLGKDYGMMKEYHKWNPDVLHVDYISAPDYLHITSLAYIGLVSYQWDSLNTAYCAPNKIYEYAFYGIPILANNVPGLKYTVGYNNMGVILESMEENSIINGIKKIEDNYRFYSFNSKKMFLEQNNEKVIKKALKSLDKKG